LRPGSPSARRALYSAARAVAYAALGKSLLGGRRRSASRLMSTAGSMACSLAQRTLGVLGSAERTFGDRSSGLGRGDREIQGLPIMIKGSRA
jgi:hypothetical protein